MDGQALTFELVGLNNQNFIMKDHQTGSWWQQVTGEAIQGPLKGSRLTLKPFDEVSFAIWKREHPDTQVLAPDDRYAEFYFGPGEKRPQDGGPFAFPTSVDGGDEVELGALVLGLKLGGRAKAYPMDVLRKQNPIADLLGGQALLLVVAEDGNSVRAFHRQVEGQRLDLFRKAESDPLRLVDAQTGSEWDFSGTALSGPLEGKQLERLPVIKDYWFDWKQFNPETSVYNAGVR